MKNQDTYFTLILILAIGYAELSCEYPYTLFMSSISDNYHIADSAYYTNSRKTIPFNASNQKELAIIADTLTMKLNGVIKEVIYIKSYTWQGKKKYGTQILTGLNPMRKAKSIRIHVENLKKRGQRMFITSEIMDGEYNAANDTIWTYYKPNPD